MNFSYFTLAQYLSEWTSKWCVSLAFVGVMGVTEAVREIALDNKVSYVST